MKVFKTEEEREAYLTAEANRQIEWEKGLTYTDPETGEQKPTQQALNHRTFEEAYKIAERQLWRENIPENALEGRYVRIWGGTTFRHSMNEDYSPKLDVIKSKHDIYICNCVIDGEIEILYQGKVADVPNELLDKLLCTGDSSYNEYRPFRWYRTPEFATAICVMTTTEEEIHAGRMDSLNSYLKEIGEPDFITIFKV